MEFRGNKRAVGESRAMDIIHCLSQIGSEAVKIRIDDDYYNSRLRGEKTPSFNVTRWYNLGIGKGGNRIDFALLFWGSSVSEALVKPAGNFSLQQHPQRPFKIASEKQARIKTSRAFSCALHGLFRYVEKRRISAKIVSIFCRELRYKVAGSIGYDVGFKNDPGSYAIRNIFHKLCSAPKGITSILNSFFFPVSTLAILGSYKDVLLFPDNDTSGKVASRLALSWGNYYPDKSNRYDSYNGFNDWLINAPKRSDVEISAGSLIRKKPPNLPGN